MNAHFVALLVAVFVAGCPTSSAPPPPVLADGDGDGSPDADDCAPEDASVHPGAEEACDGLDTDCDGTVPDGEEDEDLDGSLACGGDCDDGDPTLYGHDGDADGVSPCDGDCDDADAARFPGNVEDACDGIDGDCVLDPGEADGDGDGYLACADDCDDGRANVHPGHVEECDGRDNDCDGIRDEDGPGPVPLQGEVSLGLAQAKFLGEYPDDKLGSFVAAPGDVNGDGFQDYLVGTNRCFTCGTFGFDPSIANRVYLLYGPICGEVQLGPVEDGIVDAILWGQNVVSRVGDLDGESPDRFARDSSGPDQYPATPLRASGSAAIASNTNEMRSIAQSVNAGVICSLNVLLMPSS